MPGHLCVGIPALRSQLIAGAAHLTLTTAWRGCSTVTSIDFVVITADFIIIFVGIINFTLGLAVDQCSLERRTYTDYALLVEYAEISSCR